MKCLLLDTEFDTHEINEAIRAYASDRIIIYDPTLDTFSGPDLSPTCALMSIYGMRKLWRKYPEYRSCLSIGDTLETFDYSQYAASIGPQAVNYRASWIPVGVLRESRRCHAPRIFCRPNSGWKPWSGFILEEGQSLEEVGIEAKLDTQMAVVGPVHNIGHEIRFHIANGKIVTHGVYNEKTVLVSPKLLQTAYTTLIRLQPRINVGSHYVIDLAYMTDEGVYKVVEMNSWSCSGIYDIASIPAIVDASFAYDNSVL